MSILNVSHFCSDTVFCDGINENKGDCLQRLNISDLKVYLEKNLSVLQ